MKMVVVHEEYAFLEDFIRELPLQFENEGVTLHNGRNCVKTFLVDGVRIVVKRFRRPNLFNRCVYAWFRKSKAERAYGNALELLFHLNTSIIISSLLLPTSAKARMESF